ncbi:MAG: DUF4251 domain-containing protein [Muribaculaceae bacterium]|nr:DUF4251 domain-containing protein [Muribaculaceae bacterium]MBR6490617.1 DUF4251 domain-containing protein [Muribaculaceae bacterium]
MKTFNFVFSLLLVAILSVPATTLAQTYDDIYVIEKTGDIPENETKKERKERIKKDHEIVDSIYHLKALYAIEDGYFVLQATQISNSYGNWALGLNDNSNFLLMQGDKGIFQVAYNTMSAGANGLGGVTLHGRISNMDIKEDKKGNAIISYNMIGRRMNAYVTITLFKGGDTAIATIDPTLGRGRITMRGRLVPYQNDKIKIEP